MRPCPPVLATLVGLRANSFTLVMWMGVIIYRLFDSMKEPVLHPLPMWPVSACKKPGQRPLPSTQPASNF